MLFHTRRAHRGRRDIALGISDDDAIARAHTLASKRTGPFDGLEVWDGARFVFRRPSGETLGADPGLMTPPDD